MKNSFVLPCFLIIICICLSLTCPSYAKDKEKGFSDVDENAFYYDAVMWANSTDPKIVAGITEELFKPYNNCNRAQVVSFLWRLYGCPEPDTVVNPFIDVDESSFYYKPVLWASENDITSGITASKFAPFNTCTRSQFVTFLWRAAGKPEPSDSINPFVDIDNNRFYTDAVLWAFEKRITSGKDATHFNPAGIINRAQTVAFLYRFNSLPQPATVLTLSFEPGEGTGQMDDILLTAENAYCYELPESTFTSPEGKKFMYWTCEGIVLEPGAHYITGDDHLTFIANWMDEDSLGFKDEDKHTINLNGGKYTCEGEEKTGVFATLIEDYYDFFFRNPFEKELFYLADWVDSKTGNHYTVGDFIYRNMTLPVGSYITANWKPKCKVSFCRDGEEFYSFYSMQGYSFEREYDKILEKLGEIDEDHVFLGFTTPGDDNHYCINAAYEFDNTRNEDTDTKKYIYNFIVTNDIVFNTDIRLDEREKFKVTYDLDEKDYYRWNKGAGHLISGPDRFEFEVREGESLYTSCKDTISAAWNSGYIFDGFKISEIDDTTLLSYDEVTEYVPNGDIIITPVWSVVNTHINRFEPGEFGEFRGSYGVNAIITYDNENLIAEVNENESIYYFEPDPISDEYLFEGWIRDDGEFFPPEYSDIVNNNRDTVYTAKWFQKGGDGDEYVVKLTLIANGGTIYYIGGKINDDGNDYITYAINEGKTLSGYSAQKEGFKLVGWRVVKGNKEGEFVDIWAPGMYGIDDYYKWDKDTVIEAIWEEKTEE